MKKTVLGVVWLVAFGFGAAADEPKTEEVKKKALDKALETPARRLLRIGGHGNKFSPSGRYAPDGAWRPLPVGDDVGHRRIIRIDRLHDGEPARMRPLDLHGIACGVAVHGN